MFLRVHDHHPILFNGRERHPAGLYLDSIPVPLVTLHPAFKVSWWGIGTVLCIVGCVRNCWAKQTNVCQPEMHYHN